MTDILPIAGWPNVRQLETNEFATGGANGNMNEQAKSLAARSELLKKYAALPYESKTGGYALNERVQLATGDIVRSTIPSNVNNPNENMTGWEIPNNGIESIADLRGLTPTKAGQTIRLISVNAGQNEGGGDFIATQKSGLVDNGGTVVSTTKPEFFWVRINQTTTSFEDFGAKKNDTAFDSYDSIQRCLNNSTNIQAKEGVYYVSQGLVVPSKLKKIIGVSQESTIIEKTTTHKKTVLGVEVDFAMYFDYTGESEDITYYKKIEDFSLRKSGLIKDTGFAMYAHKLALSQFSNIRFSRFEYGFRSFDTWMTQFDRVTAHCLNGWKITSGTSTVLNACWTIGVTGICYDFQNMLYSTMISCGADFSGTEANPAQQVFNIQWSELTIIGMGYEKSFLRRFAYIHDSKVNIINLRGLSISNKYSTGFGAWLDIVSGSKVLISNCNFGLLYSKSSPELATVPSALYIRDASTFNDVESSLFRTYTRDDININNANVFSDTRGNKFEIVLITDGIKEIRTNRTLVSNEGYSIEKNPDTVQDNGSYHYNSSGSLMSYNMLNHTGHRNNKLYAWQVGVAAGETNMAELKARVLSNGVWSTPAIIYNSDNVIVDENGFLKLKP